MDIFVVILDLIEKWIEFQYRKTTKK